MAQFDIALQEVLQNEGGYINDPDDVGGETYKGISRKMHPKWEGWVIIDQAKKNGAINTLESSKDLSNKVAQFYKEKFWDVMLLDGITSQDVANLLFDSAVNMGISATLAMVNLILGDKDDYFNPLLINKINLSQTFKEKFVIARISRYIYICTKRPTSRKYLYGWIVRTLQYI